MAGDSGGVFGTLMDEGDGGALTLDKNRRRRSTRVRVSGPLEYIANQCHPPCLVLWVLRAISFLRSVAFFAPTDALRSLEACKSASNRSRSIPPPLTGESGGRRGDNCLGRSCDFVGGGVRSWGL